MVFAACLPKDLNIDKNIKKAVILFLFNWDGDFAR